jgi:hypothetical protein
MVSKRNRKTKEKRERLKKTVKEKTKRQEKTIIE